MTIDRLEISYEELRSILLEVLRSKHQTQYVEVLYGVAAQAVSKKIVANPYSGVVTGAQYELHEIDKNRILELIWDLIIERILTMGGGSIGQGWPFLNVTEYGREVLSSKEPIPHDPSGYIKRLYELVPEADPVIVTYIQESLRTYNIRALLSATIALGCASEKAILVLIDAFAAGIADQGKRDAFLSKINGSFIKSKYDEFLKRIIPIKKVLPKELVDGLEITLTGVFEMIRTNRNDAGHPTGNTPPREQVYASLQLFIPYLRKIIDLADYFKMNKVNV